MVLSPQNLVVFTSLHAAFAALLYSLKDKDGDDDSTLDTLESLGAVMLEISERE